MITGDRSTLGGLIVKDDMYVKDAAVKCRVSIRRASHYRTGSVGIADPAATSKTPLEEECRRTSHGFPVLSIGENGRFRVWMTRTEGLMGAHPLLSTGRSSHGWVNRKPIRVSVRVVVCHVLLIVTGLNSRIDA